MLTKEQIKNLKKGAPIVIHTKFYHADSAGDIWFDAPVRNCDERLDFISPDYVSLPSDSQSTATAQLLRSRDGSTVNSQSKYAPTRPFKKGDMVQPRSGKTVLASEYGVVTFHELAGQYEVKEDEARGTVTLIVNGHACFVSAFALELISPIEEREPYSIYESKEEESFDIMKRVGKLYLTRNCIYYKSDNNDHAELTREEALAAAEAECKRLNEEYRKKHANG